MIKNTHQMLLLPMIVNIVNLMKLAGYKKMERE